MLTRLSFQPLELAQTLRRALREPLLNDPVEDKLLVISAVLRMRCLAPKAQKNILAQMAGIAMGSPDEPYERDAREEYREAAQSLLSIAFPQLVVGAIIAILSFGIGFLVRCNLH